MSEHRLSLLDALARAAVPLAALAAMAALTLRDVDPVGGAEGWYLAVLSTAVLLAAAFLAPPSAPAWEAGVGAMLATAAVWALPPGPGRGAAVVLLLVGVLAVAAARRLAPDPDHLPLSVTVPLALGLQVLLRGGELLFQPQANVRTLVALLALPVAGAVATTVLARRYGSFAPIAAGTALMLSPGWNVAATLGLIALAAADLIDRPEVGRIARAAAGLAVLAPIAWEPWPGLTTAVAALALIRPKEGFFVALPLSVLFAHLFHGPTWQVGSVTPFLLLLFSHPVRSERLLLFVAGLALAVTVPFLPDLSTMAGPLALVALSAAPVPWQEEKAGLGPWVGEVPGMRGLQGLWTTTFLAATALLASYPWLRAEPLREAFGLVGIKDLSDSAAPLLALLIPVILWRLATWRGFSLAPATLPALLAGLLFAAAWVHLPATGTLLLPAESAVVVDAARPSWQARFEGQPVRAVVIESSLSNGAGLANGTVIATVRLRGADGRQAAWVLRAGEDTGEWAARRPDVAAASVLQSPPAWISWVAGDFFGQRYRSRWIPDRTSPAGPLPGPFTELTVEWSPALPPQVSLALHRVEVRR